MSKNISSFTLASIIKTRPFLSDFLSIMCKDYNPQKPMATPQDFALQSAKKQRIFEIIFPPFFILH